MTVWRQENVLKSKVTERNVFYFQILASYFSFIFSKIIVNAIFLLVLKSRKTLLCHLVSFWQTAFNKHFQNFKIKFKKIMLVGYKLTSRASLAQSKLSSNVEIHEKNEHIDQK